MEVAKLPRCTDVDNPDGVIIFEAVEKFLRRYVFSHLFFLLATLLAYDALNDRVDTETSSYSRIYTSFGCFVQWSMKSLLFCQTS